MTGPVLCLNAGSSSLKFALWPAAAGARRLAAGVVEGLGGDAPRVRLRDADGRVVRDEPAAARDAAAAVPCAWAALAAHDHPPPAAVGHRLVHGGPTFAAPVRLDAATRAALDAVVELAPLHLPGELAVVDAAAAHFPGVPQVACFDTAFHRGMPAVARRLPLPRALRARGVERYGFHGLSYEYVVGRLGSEAAGRVVIAHLGSGASLAAVRDGAPVDTTMGFTPAGGVVMGTRSGDLDPGVPVHLLRHGFDAEALERLVTHESGLLGLSGTTADMAALLARRDRDPAAAEAVASFCWSVRKAVGALAAALDGLDVLVFTGGIGEHAAAVRAEVCAGLSHLGVRLDPARNAAHAERIGAADARCAVRVVATDEERVVARHTAAVLGLAAGGV